MDIDSLYEVQLDLSGRITRSFSNFQKLGKVKMTSIPCQVRLEQLERDFTTFLNNHDKIVTLEGYDEHEYSTTSLFDKTQETYFELVGNFKGHLLACNAPLNLNASGLEQQGPTQAVVSAAFNQSLPKIEIPKSTSCMSVLNLNLYHLPKG